MTEQVDEAEKAQVARLKILRVENIELWSSMTANVLREYDT